MIGRYETISIGSDSTQTDASFDPSSTKPSAIDVLFVKCESFYLPVTSDSTDMWIRRMALAVLVSNVVYVVVPRANLAMQRIGNSTHSSRGVSHILATGIITGLVSMADWSGMVISVPRLQTLSQWESR